jgi:hypothetical protein
MNIFRKTKGKAGPEVDPVEPEVTPETEVPDLCSGSFDVIANVRKEIFIFKDQV